MKTVKIVTDGSCLGNPGPGGWAVLLSYRGHRRELSGGAPRTTNNRMELTAVLEGLQALKEPCSVTVETDSQYVRNGMTRWIHKWKAKGWGSIKNRDLWEALDRAASRHKVRWVWVRGHANHADNNRCDRIARDAAQAARTRNSR